LFSVSESKGTGKTQKSNARLLIIFWEDIELFFWEK
jgi:hypothetical protein